MLECFVNWSDKKIDKPKWWPLVEIRKGLNNGHWLLIDEDHHKEQEIVVLPMQLWCKIPWKGREILQTTCSVRTQRTSPFLSHWTPHRLCPLFLRAYSVLWAMETVLYNVQPSILYCFWWTLTSLNANLPLTMLSWLLEYFSHITFNVSYLGVVLIFRVLIWSYESTRVIAFFP